MRLARAVPNNCPVLSGTIDINFCWRHRPQPSGAANARHNSAYYPDPYSDRSIADLALQPRLGILSDRRLWPPADNPDHSSGNGPDIEGMPSAYRGELSALLGLCNCFGGRLTTPWIDTLAEWRRSTSSAVFSYRDHACAPRAGRRGNTAGRVADDGFAWRRSTTGGSGVIAARRFGAALRFGVGRRRGDAQIGAGDTAALEGGNRLVEGRRFVEDGYRLADHFSFHLARNFSVRHSTSGLPVGSKLCGWPGRWPAGPV
jgi:hypothetical protein